MTEVGVMKVYSWNISIRHKNKNKTISQTSQNTKLIEYNDFVFRNWYSCFLLYVSFFMLCTLVVTNINTLLKNQGGAHENILSGVNSCYILQNVIIPILIFFTCCVFMTDNYANILGPM